MFKVAHAAAIPSSHPLAKDALPARFPFLVSIETEQVVEPILAFLGYRFLFQQGTWRPNTVEAVCYDLLDWWNYLEFKGIKWNLAEGEDLVDFRNALIITTSPKSHRRLSNATINRRLTYISQFYDWARNRYGYDGSIQLELRHEKHAIDRNPLAHLGSERLKKSMPSWQKLKSDSHNGESIRPLSRESWLKVAELLGPLPSSSKNDTRPSRDRLAAELAILTGMRVDEIAGLRADDILRLPDDDDPFKLVVISISRTKGLKKRKVLFPSYFLRELKAYIKHERAQAVGINNTQCRLRQKVESLFINHRSASRNAGKPTSPATFSRAFKAAVLKAGLSRPEQRYDPDKNKTYFRTCPLHTFHDLRHTFAVCMYYAEISAGNHEPWKAIQARLGHSQLQTTMDIYLRTVEVERIQFSGKLYTSLAALTRE